MTVTITVVLNDESDASVAVTWYVPGAAGAVYTPAAVIVPPAVPSATLQVTAADACKVQLSPTRHISDDGCTVGACAACRAFVSWGEEGKSGLTDLAVPPHEHNHSRGAAMIAMARKDLKQRMGTSRQTIWTPAGRQENFHPGAKARTFTL